MQAEAVSFMDLVDLQKDLRRIPVVELETPTVVSLALPCLALPCLALPCLALPCLALPYIALLCVPPALFSPFLAIPLKDRLTV